MELIAETKYTRKGTLIGDYRNRMYLGSIMGSNYREFFWTLFYFMYLLNGKSERNTAQNMFSSATVNQI
jgi:hypothetical protein